ncbi:hypothetical protein LTR28_000581, partial [Elasticomyces elasticus]
MPCLSVLSGLPPVSGLLSSALAEASALGVASSSSRSSSSPPLLEVLLLLGFTTPLESRPAPVRPPVRSMKEYTGAERKGGVLNG